MHAATSQACKPPRGYGRALILLLLLALVPRIVAACCADTVRRDSTYFIEAARRLDAGDPKLALEYLGPNPYVVVLWLLHKLGLGYELGGTVWSVAVSTLAVLPLVGYVRRKFNVRIAYVAGFLYALHPRFIEWGAEILRDPTFWLFFMLTLYLLERAARSTTPAWLLAAAGAFTVAAHLRSEGWLLVLPATAALLPNAARRTERRPGRFVIRACLVALVPLGVMVLLNRFVFIDNPQWGRLDYLAIGVKSKLGEAWNALTGSAAATVASSGKSVPHEFAYLAKKVLKGLSPPLAVVAVVGLVRLRRRALRPAFAAPLVMSCLVFVLTGAYLFAYGEINTRYVLAAALPLLPYAAFGLIVLRNRLSNFFRQARPRFGVARVRRRYVTAAIVAALSVYGVIEGLDVDRMPLRHEARIGYWLAANCGAEANIAGFTDSRLARYYAGDIRHFVELSCESASWQAELRETRPDVVLVDKPHADAFAQFAAEHCELGYAAVSISPAASGLVVYRCSRPPAASAARADAVTIQDGDSTVKR